MSASSRSLDCAISSALARPSASSMSTSSPIGRVSPSFVSSWVNRTSTHQTSRARRTLGTISTSTQSRAPVTISMMSPWHHGVSMPLTRTARTVRPQSRPVSAPTAMARADSFTAGAQASSRSKNTRSAPDVGAFSHMRSLLAGVASSERRARGARTVPPSDRPGRTQRVEPLGAEAEEATVDGIVVGAEVSARGAPPAPGCRSCAPRAPAPSWTPGRGRPPRRTSHVPAGARPP